MTDLLTRAHEWIAGDPDPATRSELEQLVASSDTETLESRFEGTLTFGTAGIRGEVGAGPNRMNRAVVIRTTAGLATHLGRVGPVGDRPIVVGYDARPTSRGFAEDTAGVLAAAGFPVTFFPDFAPTPLVAFAAKHLDAAAAVVVTASHNPPADNGYKVYDSNAAQIIPPTDVSIARAVDEIGFANDVPRISGVFDGTSELVTVLGDDIVDRYWEEVNRARPQPVTSSLRIVYTPMHGVGGVVLSEVFMRAGHSGLIPVPDQAIPDGTFPTVAFPNPEEPGALDLAIDLARSSQADLIVANDPDADRLAVVTPHAGEWRALSGNEIGVLLGDFVLSHHPNDKTPIVINSIVSSPMLGRIADLRGARHEVTLTGFKWIVNAGLALEDAGEGRFVFGYEEALGYTIGSTVRDKDGISAALVFADLVAVLRAEDQSVIDRLEELWQEAGVWASAQHAVVLPGAEGAHVIQNAVARLASDPPSSIGAFEIESVTDYRIDGEERPFWLGEQALVELSLGSRGRVLVRPSGTEPKLKIYIDLTEAAGNAPGNQQEALRTTASDLALGMAGVLDL